jgi:hypothetical protein
VQEDIYSDYHEIIEMITEEVGIQDGIATQHVRNVEVEWSD